jgi:uncharacterized RDD family membrane protein YckC
VERSIDVATGESVVFSYELAGLGSRFLAVFIDMLIQTIVFIAALIAVTLLAAGVTVAGPAANSAQAAKIGYAIVIGLAFFAIFMLFFGYFILFEWLWQGRTPGKRLLGIRVVRDGGFPVDFVSSVIRNVVRILEAGLGFYAISAICTILSPQNRRLGDMAAGTIVVRDERYFRAYAPSEGEGLADDPVVRDLSPEQRDLIRQYGARRLGLNADARAKVAATIASSVRPKLGASYDHLDDDTLLAYLAQHALRSL